MTRFSNRIDRRFAELAGRGRKGLIPYVTAGHPKPELTVDIMHSLVAAGADLLELGIPFSDVMADGPVIQHACEAALKQGMTLDKVFAQVADFRRRDDDTPVILMGYMNPVERRGLDTFAEQAAEVGVDGLLIVDCPADEAVDTTRVFDGRELHQIFLVAPTTTEARIERMAPLAGGFIYYVSLKGVTGSAALNADELAPAVESIRARSDLPVAVGFGISTPEQAQAVGRIADAVVIGSALVRKLEEAETGEAAGQIVTEYIGGIRTALDSLGRAEPAEARA